MSLPRPVASPSEDTRDRLLSAAEELFMSQGFTAPSLRAITSRARVNLAAVNYHFGSRAALIREVLKRRLGPLNGARVAALDRLEAAAAGAPLPVEVILEALLLPALQLSQDPRNQGATVFRLLGRAFAEPADSMRTFLPAQHEETADRFREALSRALPHLPRTELVWRMHFAFGAIACTMAGDETLRLIAAGEADRSIDAGSIVRRLVPFLAAGLRAPVPAECLDAGEARPNTLRAA
ncbi:MAG: TetR/AcrR family transcriptional regulator [Burkholderiales bacterium]